MQAKQAIKLMCLMQAIPIGKCGECHFCSHERAPLIVAIDGEFDQFEKRNVLSKISVVD